MEKMARFRCSEEYIIELGGGLLLFLILFCPRSLLRMYDEIRRTGILKKTRGKGSHGGCFGAVCKAGTTAEGQTLLANISTGRASLLQSQNLIQEK